MIKFKLTLVVAFVLSTGVLINCFAYKMYLYVDSIPGECTDSGHINWIDVTGFAHGLTRNVNDVIHSGVTLTKQLDKSSPELFMQLCQASIVNEVKVEFTDVTYGNVFYRVTLQNVHIKDVSQGADTTGSQVSPSESVCFLYKTITWEYMRYNASGALMETITQSYTVQ